MLYIVASPSLAAWLEVPLPHDATEIPIDLETCFVRGVVCAKLVRSWRNTIAHATRPVFLLLRR
jgi:hypothetical protein